MASVCRSHKTWNQGAVSAKKGDCSLGIQNTELQKLTETAQIPTRRSVYAVGYTVYADLPGGPLEIPAKGMRAVHTGIALRLPPYTFGGIYALPELAYQKRLYPDNSVGILEEDYNGELYILLRNDSDQPQTVTHGEGIAQLVVQGYVPTLLKEVDSFVFSDDDE